MKALRVTERPEAIRAGRFVASMGAPYQVKFFYLIGCAHGRDETARTYGLRSLGHTQILHLLQRIQFYNISFPYLS